MKPARSAARSALVLATFALLSAGIIGLTHELTSERIQANERAAERAKLHSIVAPSSYDNDLINDSIQVTAPEKLGSEQPLTVYRARKEGEPVAAILTVVAPDGYNGPIRLLVGIRPDGRIAGVRVLEHQETAGLGDGIEASKSDWLQQFRGAELGDPKRDEWGVRQDGGEFDALSGATVTPRAVVGAIRRALSYFEEHRDKLMGDADGKP